MVGMLQLMEYGFIPGLLFSNKKVYSPSSQLKLTKRYIVSFMP